MKLFIIFTIGLSFSLAAKMKGEVTALAPVFQSHKINSVTMKEIWKDVIGFEGYYKISNTGKVKSLHKKLIGINSNKKHIIKQSENKNGYFHVCLCVNQKRKTIPVHRLVAIHFVQNIYKKPVVNHIDFNVKNNNSSNLEWVTIKENVMHSYNNGRINPPKYWKDKFGYENHSSKEVKQYDLLNNLICTFGSAHEAMRETGINNKHISRVARNERKTAGGFIWKYT